MPNDATDRGFTLVELLISGLLFSLVVLVVGGILVSSFQAQSTVRSVTGGTTDAQLATNVMESDLRRASAVSVADAGADSQLARLRVVTPNLVECVAWLYHEPTEAIYERRSSMLIAVPSESAEAPEGWRLIIDGVTASTGAAVFVQAGQQGLQLQMLKSSNDAQTTTISTTISGRVPLAVGSPPCFD